MTLRRSERIFKKTHRRFPNEIFALIIFNLADDLFSLQDLALVCKDFAALAQRHIFREIDLSGKRTWTCVGQELKFSCPLVHRLAPLTHNRKLSRLVQRLSFFSPSSMFPDEVQLIARILETLPHLTCIDMNSPHSRHLHSITGSSMSKNLRVLHIRSSANRIYGGIFANLQKMLTSLMALEVLAISGSFGYITPGILLLPSSIRVLSVVQTDKAIIEGIGWGLESSHPPLIQTLFLDQNSDGEECAVLWRGLQTDVQVVLEMQSGGSRDRFLSALVLSTKGMRVTKLIFVCFPSDLLPSLFANLIPNLPLSVCELCIDIAAYSYKASGPNYNLRLHLQDWTDFDSVLVDRHQLGLLKRVCFRCTIREHSDSLLDYNYSCVSLKPRPKSLCVEDRTILLDLGSLLPRSKSMGFLEVDHDTMIFAPTM